MGDGEGWRGTFSSTKVTKRYLPTAETICLMLSNAMAPPRPVRGERGENREERGESKEGKGGRGVVGEERVDRR